MTTQNNEKKALGGAPLRADWGKTIPNTNFAQGRLEWFVYALLASAGFGGVTKSNMFGWQEDGRLGLNPPGEWENPLRSLENNLAEHPENALVLQGVAGVIVILLAIFLMRAVFTSGSYAKDRLFGQ